MAEYEVQEDKKVPLIPKGFYKAELILLEKADNYEESPYKYLTGYWKVLEGKQKDTEIRESYPENISPSSKLGQLFEAVKGTPLVVGEKVDTENILHIPCNIAVNIQKIKTKQGKEFEKNIIESVMRL